MAYLQATWALLKGKKTYIVGLLMVILGLLTADNKLVLEGLGFLALRNAV